jgi:TRAP-type C4-dicarboxylate transport system permease small subunit
MTPEPSNLSPALKRIGRVLGVLSRVGLWAAAAGLVVMTVIVGWQVFTRYVLNWSNAWTEPAALLLMSWFIFLGAAAGVRENYHLGFDVLLYVLPRDSKRLLRTISDVVVASFAIGMIYYGMQLVELGWSATMPSLGIPEGIKYIPLVVGGVLILLFALERLAMRFAGTPIDADLEFEEIPEIDPKEA